MKLITYIERGQNNEGVQHRGFRWDGTPRSRWPGSSRIGETRQAFDARGRRAHMRAMH